MAQDYLYDILKHVPAEHTEYKAHTERGGQPSRRAFMNSVFALAAAQLGAGGAAAAFGASAFSKAALASDNAAPAKPFSFDDLINTAFELAQKSYVKPSALTEDKAHMLGYDEYRDVRFRSDKAIWRGTQSPYQLQLFPTGWLYKYGVTINLIENGAARPLKAQTDFFQFGKVVEAKKDELALGFSGFRIHGPIKTPDYLDEFSVFQGASYFRAVGREHSYGLSARGLAVNTAQPAGEEFPEFREFWIEKPKKGAHSIRVYALLDSPSVCGAYQFVISPGANTQMDVRSSLFVRKELSHIGIAPLTSMFLFGPNDQLGFDDFRPAVHDSQLLAILNGKGEALHRPLTNPKHLEASAFMDEAPKGFGLIQRGRSFEKYQDLEARYEKRPSLWIEPTGSWGRGAVQLIEIPSEKEIHDNIVAFWRPQEELKPGQRHDFNYRLYWCDDVPVAWPEITITDTRTGNAADSVGMQAKSGRIFSVDYKSKTPIFNAELKSDALITASAGKISKPVLRAGLSPHDLRVSFVFDPEGAKAADMRMELKLSPSHLAETWIYRWTRD